MDNIFNDTNHQTSLKIKWNIKSGTATQFSKSINHPSPHVYSFQNKIMETMKETNIF